MINISEKKLRDIIAEKLAETDLDEEMIEAATDDIIEAVKDDQAEDAEDDES